MVFDKCHDSKCGCRRNHNDGVGDSGDHKLFTLNGTTCSICLEEYNNNNNNQLPASETMGATSSGTSLSATFRDAAWTYTTATGFVGLPATYDSAAYPAANASDDESRDYTWTWDGTYHVLKVSIDHGGEREERRSWRFGTLNREGFLKGSSVVWTVVRDIDGPTGLVMSDANGNGDSTDYTYDDAGRLLTMSPADDDPTSVTYALTSTPPTVTLDGAAGTITST